MGIDARPTPTEPRREFSARTTTRVPPGIAGGGSVVDSLRGRAALPREASGGVLTPFMLVFMLKGDVISHWSEAQQGMSAMGGKRTFASSLRC